MRIVLSAEMTVFRGTPRREGIAMSDEEKWLHHGVNPAECRKALKPFKDRRNAMIAKATSMAEKLGHALSPDWSPLSTNRCRKCGRTVELPNVHAQTSVPDVRGAAVTYPCDVSLSNIGPDHIYWRDFEINVGPDDAML